MIAYRVLRIWHLELRQHLELHLLADDLELPDADIVVVIPDGTKNNRSAAQIIWRDSIYEGEYVPIGIWPDDIPYVVLYEWSQRDL